MTRTTTRITLGTISNGSLCRFDGLGTFKTVAAAIAAYNSAPRNRGAGDLVVIENDLGYGFSRESLVDLPSRRRRAQATVPITPEQVRDEITARLRALPRDHAERVVYSWPDEILVEETQR